MVTKIDASMFDAQGKEIILDADADTSITADTDNQIDIKIAGADDFQFTANTFTALSGSTVAIASGATIANSGTATGFGGGAWNLIQSVTASTSASLTVTGMDATYDQYCIIFSDLDMDTDNQRMNFRMGDSSGIDSGASDYAFWACKITTGSSSTFGGENNQTEDYIEVGGDSFGAATGEGFGGVYWITGPSDSAEFPKIVGQYNGFTHSGMGMMGFTMGKRNSDIVLDRIQIYPGGFGVAAGNFVTGRMTLWGIAHA